MSNERVIVVEKQTSSRKDCFYRLLSVFVVNDKFQFFKREGFSKYNKIYEFNYFLFGENCRMIMTSLSGHLLNYEFVGFYRKW